MTGDVTQLDQLSTFGELVCNGRRQLLPSQADVSAACIQEN